ncbi:hypothetical protein PM082_018540 [Marasmius tenuissimus]|nr:hypothetical protein PM082_018540 [Marasmius tenuissimus]
MEPVSGSPSGWAGSSGHLEGHTVTCQNPGPETAVALAMLRICKVCKPRDSGDGKASYTRAIANSCPPVFSSLSPSSSAMTTHFFQGAVTPRIGRNSVFQNVEGNVNNNYLSCTSCQEREEDRVLPMQSLFREFFMGDVFLRERTCSQELEVVIRKPSLDPLQAGLETRVKVTKKYYTATIYPDSGQALTVITLEPEHVGDREVTRLVSYILEFREPQLTQLLGFMKSSIPSFILHQELVNIEFLGQYLGLDEDLDEDSDIDSDADPVNDRQLRQFYNQYIVFSYLVQTRAVAFQALRADTTLTIPVSYDSEDWNFSLTTGTWHYDITSASIRPLAEVEIDDSDDESDFSTSIPLPPGTTPPRLDADDIMNCFEKTFGDALYLMASFGQPMDNLTYSDSEQDELLTLGAVLNDQAEIIAHFSSTPTPEWSFEDRSLGVKASWSTTGFVDEIGFVITGDFESHDPPPAYLFVPPLCVKVINGMHCISGPLPNPLFFWTIDPAGEDVIPKEEWEGYGIPELGLKFVVGSIWEDLVHHIVRGHMRKKGYETADSRRYAQDHGYPELLLGDPHDQRMEQLQNSDTDESTLGRVSSGSDDEYTDRANGCEDIQPSAGDHNRRGQSSYWFWFCVFVVAGAHFVRARCNR